MEFDRTVSGLSIYGLILLGRAMHIRPHKIKWQTEWHHSLSDFPYSRSASLFKSDASSSLKELGSFTLMVAFLDASALATSTAQLYVIIPMIAISMPIMFFPVNTESKRIHPKVRTQTVFMCPNTCDEMKAHQKFRSFQSHVSQKLESITSHMLLYFPVSLELTEKSAQRGKF